MKDHSCSTREVNFPLIFVPSIENESMWWSFRQCVLGLVCVRAVHKFISIPVAEVDAHCLNV